MRTLVALCLLAFAPGGWGQDRTESRELVGQLGSRTALLVLHSAQRSDGGWQMAGEYILVPGMVRRYLEGERSPELGVTTLKEGTSAILFGRPPTGELRGAYRAGVFRGTRVGPGGQERERFEFTEEFAPMDGYGAAVSCDAAGERYESSLAFAVEAGKVKSFQWRSKVSPSGHACILGSLQQQSFKGGLRLASGRCSVTLREVGDYVKVAAENCGEHCGSDAFLEPVLVERRGGCRLLRPEAR